MDHTLQNSFSSRKKIFITGIAGFIGFHLARYLKSKGDIVLGCDNFNDYYDRKKKIQSKFETTAQKRNAIQENWVFENCCVLVLDKNTLKPNQIFNTVKTKLIALDISENQIESISQLASSKN